MQRIVSGVVVGLLVLGPWGAPSTYAQGWGAVGKWINPQVVEAVAAATHSSPAVRLTELKTTQAMYAYLNGCRAYFAAVADYAVDVAQQEATATPLTTNPSVAAEPIAVGPVRAKPTPRAAATRKTPATSRQTDAAPLPPPSLFTTVKLAAKVCGPLLLAYRDQEAVLQTQLADWWSALDAGSIHATGNYSEPIALAIHEFTAATRRVFFQPGHTDMGELKDAPQCAGDFVSDAVLTRYLLAAFRAGTTDLDYLWGLTEMQRHLGCLSPAQSYQLDFALRVGAEYTDVVLAQRGFQHVRTKFRSALLNLFLLTADAHSPLGSTYTYRWLRTHLTPALLAATNSVLPNQQLGLYDPHRGKLVFFGTSDDSGVFANAAAQVPTRVQVQVQPGPRGGLSVIAGSGLNPHAPTTTPSVPASEYPPTGFGIPTDVAAKENCVSGPSPWKQNAGAPANHYPLSALQYILDPTHQGHGLCAYLDLLRSDGKCRLGLCGDREMELHMLTGGKGLGADRSVGGAPAAGAASGTSCESDVPTGVFACLDQAQATDRSPVSDSSDGWGRGTLPASSRGDNSEFGRGTGPGNVTPGCKDYGSAPISVGQSSDGGGDDAGTKGAKDGDDADGGDGQDDGDGDDNSKASKDDDDAGNTSGESTANSSSTDDEPTPSGGGAGHRGGPKDPAPSDFGFYPGNGGGNGSPPGGPPGAHGQLPNPGWQPGMQSPPAPTQTSPGGAGTRAAPTADPAADSEQQLREKLVEVAKSIESMADPTTGAIAEDNPGMEALKAQVRAAVHHPIMEQRFVAGRKKADHAITLPMLQGAVQSAVGSLYPGLDQPTLDLVGPVMDGLVGVGKGVMFSPQGLHNLGVTEIPLEQGAIHVKIYAGNRLINIIKKMMSAGDFQVQSDGQTITDDTFALVLEQFERGIMGTFLHERIAHVLTSSLGLDWSNPAGHLLLDTIGQVLLGDSSLAVSGTGNGGSYSQALFWELWPAVSGTNRQTGSGGQQPGGAGGSGTAPQSCDPALDQCGRCNLVTQQSLAISDCHGFLGFEGQLYGSGVDKAQLPNAGLTEPKDAVPACMGQTEGGDQPCPMQQCGPGETGYYDAGVSSTETMLGKKSGGTGLACSCRKGDTPNPKALRNPKRGSIGCQVIDCPPGTVLAPGSCSCQSLDQRAQPGRAF